MPISKDDVADLMAELIELFGKGSTRLRLECVTQRDWFSEDVYLFHLHVAMPPGGCDWLTESLISIRWAGERAGICGKMTFHDISDLRREVLERLQSESKSKDLVQIERIFEARGMLGKSPSDPVTVSPTEHHATGSLWPKEVCPNIQSPEIILATQAEALTTQTGGALKCNLSKTELNGMVRISLNARADLVNMVCDYSVLHATFEKRDVYPVEVVFRGHSDTAANAQEFTDAVRNILGSSKTVSAMQSLIVRAEEARERSDSEIERK